MDDESVKMLLCIGTDEPASTGVGWPDWEELSARAPRTSLRRCFPQRTRITPDSLVGFRLALLVAGLHD